MHQINDLRLRQKAGLEYMMTYLEGITLIIKLNLKL